LQKIDGPLAALIAAIFIVVAAISMTAASFPAYWTALFTLVLTISTSGLWFETRRQAQRELRAYVSVKPIAIKGFAAGERPVIMYEMTNTGRTPAYDLSSAGQLFLMEYPATRIGNVNVEGTRREVTLFPGQSHQAQTQPIHTINEGQVAAVLKGEEYRLYVIGFVTYVDAFKRLQKTEFSCVIGGALQTALFKRLPAGRDPQWTLRTCRISRAGLKETRGGMITERIFDWAQKTPEKTAVIYNEQSLSYRSFAAQIAIARGYFLRQGYVGPGYAVLAIHNLLDFWILSLALRSLGLTTVAVGGAAMLGKLELPDIRCVITGPGEAWSDLAPLCKERCLPLLSVSFEDEPPLDTVLPEAAYEPGGHIMLTSGTTGRYKMVLNTPVIDAAFLRLKAEVIGLSRDAVLSVFHFPAWTLFGYRWAAAPWIVGGTTLIEQGREPYRALLNPHITHGTVVPAVLASILAAPANAFARNDAMQLAVGGGAMTRRQIEQVKARITTQLYNTLGSTEADNIAYTPLETEEDHRWHRLLPQRVVEIVSESGYPVPVGEIGRVRVSTKDGPIGYLGDEAATKIHFKDGYFYPGDLAIARSDGRIALQGRSTDVINIRGKKIFPGPIEDRLCEALDVSGVCLFSMQNESGEEELYVAIEISRPIDAKRLRATLHAALKAYPRAHVYGVPSLPRNPMGKIVRQAVRDRITARLSPFS
jgi:acyl-coenzyme A synthetase/AMP-(fatty) acid ligase